MNSISSFGTSTITLQFVLDRDIDVAAQDVQAAINVAGGYLPKDLPNPPTYNKVNPGRHADPHARDHLGHAAARSSERPRRHAPRAEAERSDRRRPGHDRGKPKAGRARAGQSGGHLLARPEPRGHPHAFLVRRTSTRPRAASTAREQSYTIGSNDQIFSADDYKPIIVAYKNGAPVRLGDIAKVIDSVENDQLGAGSGQEAASSPPSSSISSGSRARTSSKRSTA